MEEFVVLDSENYGVRGKMNGEKLLKKPSFGSVVRQRLSDITNSQQPFSSPINDEKRKFVSASAKDYIEHLHKENMALMKLLAERNKIIELTGAELSKMRINLQKVQQQNWLLAQTNSKMLAELNIGKDRLKAMQHELGCKEALISLKNSELEDKVKKRPCQRVQTEEVLRKCEESKGTSNANRRRQSRIQVGSSATIEQVESKEKEDEIRQSAECNYEQPESTEEKADNKRICLRRQSARFTSDEQPEATAEKAAKKRLQPRRQSARIKREEPIPTEDLFEIEETKFPVQPLLDCPTRESCPTSLDTSTIKEEKNVRSTPACNTSDIRRSSIARPTRKAAEKVQSYKEIPVNVKMRRSN